MKSFYFCSWATPCLYFLQILRVAGRSGSTGVTWHDAKLYFPHASVLSASAA
jgi:hypothetical protein